MRGKTPVLTIAALTVAVSAGAASAQLSTYYQTDGHSNTDAWQGSINTLTFRCVYPEFSIYTDGNFIREVGYNPGDPGTEYDLSGAPTGNSYTQGGSATGSYFDAGYDGRGNVYQVNYLTGNVARYDIAFQNETILFNTGRAGDSVSITYDGVSNHIWTSSLSGFIDEWDLAGNLISCFDSGAFALALAWDPQDDTLWLNDWNTGQNQQYSKTGTLLSSYSTGDRTYYGGEMPPIPAPATLALLGLGGLTAVRRKRRD